MHPQRPHEPAAIFESLAPAPLISRGVSLATGCCRCVPFVIISHGLWHMVWTGADHEICLSPQTHLGPDPLPHLIPSPTHLPCPVLQWNPATSWSSYLQVSREHTNAPCRCATHLTARGLHESHSRPPNQQATVVQPTQEEAWQQQLPLCTSWSRPQWSWQQQQQQQQWWRLQWGQWQWRYQWQYKLDQSLCQSAHWGMQVEELRRTTGVGKTWNTEGNQYNRSPVYHVYGMYLCHPCSWACGLDLPQKSAHRLCNCYFDVTMAFMQNHILYQDQYSLIVEEVHPIHVTPLCIFSICWWWSDEGLASKISISHWWLAYLSFPHFTLPSDVLINRWVW